MPYQSVDQLQKVLAEKVFHYTQDSKKASGRSLGTLVEIITFYLLKSWGFENSIAIERALSEYGNPDITHNVEYSLHPIFHQYSLSIPADLPITATKLLRIMKRDFSLTNFQKVPNTLLTTDMILRNSCIFGKQESPYPSYLSADYISEVSSGYAISVMELYARPYAMFECKRVGIEEGMKKGPQTIEKAKQGAYVAKAVSSLYKVRVPSGELRGLIYKENDEIYSKPYNELITEIIASNQVDLLKDFILTVGVVSNHGNWFTSENHNKELKVLAQSYDWLIFLTDEGLAEFITELLLEPKPLLEPARSAFLSSYSAEKGKNSFTKVQMNYDADQVLQKYFRDNVSKIEKWFNIITPKNGTIEAIHNQISKLRDKNWEKIHTI